MAMAKSDASRLRKPLPWLKNLQASLSNEESSDSSQPTEVTPKKVGKTSVKADEKEVRRRSKKKRLRRHEGNSSDDASSGGDDDAKKRKRRLLKKGVKARHKRSIEESKKAKSPVGSPRSKAAALRGQRKQKLHAMRMTSGEHDRMAAFKLKRLESAETLRDKDRNHMQPVRAARGAQKTAGAEADVEDEGEPRRRSRVRPTADKDTTDNVSKSKLRRASISKQDKPKQIEPTSLAVEKISALVKDGAGDKNEVNSRALAKSKPSDLGKRDDDKTKDLADAVIAKTLEVKDGDSAADMRSTTTEIAMQEGSTGAMKAEFSELEAIKGAMKVEPEASGDAKREQLSHEKPESVDADSTKMVPFSTSNETSVEPSGPGSKSMETDPLIDSEGTAELVRDKVKEEGQTKPPAISASTVKMENETKPDDKKLVLDEVPIPRKAPKQDSAAPPSPGSFIIPKRKIVKTVVAGRNTNTQVEPAGTIEATTCDVKRSLEAPMPVTVLPLASPQSSPNVPNDEPTRPQRKRTKIPVPVKRSSFSTQDRALMRLSRKRNSIFMAGTELAAQAPGNTSSKTGSVSRMMGYEVYDADGKMLPDFIPRLSCATKREMASDRESYVASFFGVSHTAPKAKTDPSAVNEECDDTDLDSRKMNCYEELCFERPEDREFYQRKLYGTTFVPQNLRGWMTLIVRNARFERKSTGIRFNQDRDREEFAATLSRRYTFKKSVPRCDIPRENWQKLMSNKPATVYLHYYNREDAERAAQVFRDDHGQPLQIRWELKAGARIKRCSSPAIRPRPQLSPRRSCSSERSAPDSSPLSSHNGSARNTPVWRRERDTTSRRDDRYSRYDRGASPAQRSREESRERRYGPSLSGNKRSHGLLERRSRSRSRSKSFHNQHYESSGQVNRAGSRASGSSNQHPRMTDNHARIDGGNESASSAVHSDVGTPAQKRTRLLPRRFPPSSHDRSAGRGKNQGDLGGKEVKSSSVAASNNSVGNLDGGDNNRGMPRARSPPRRWREEPNNPTPRERRNTFTVDSRDRSKGPPAGQHRSNQQPHNRDPVQGRPRSCSRPKTSLPARDGHGGDRDGRNKERVGSREFGRGGGFNRNARERRMHSDGGREGHNDRSGGVNSRAP
ncbi:hypothetical protein L917_05615 [Phytophthora nicotianae]|uniref:Uncharacterized protein n=2 Tax=Phytophthora nicotianae TaxID=4792 RepID=V9FHL6_PHYNI|nr:hypothetical protein F443_05912 [Phytophthora nicotianae P1569]ETL97030.1 hypothetical protein L917_05615 [Phytophthora nicotianae]